MAAIRVLVSGTGNMGRQVGIAVRDADDMELAGFLDALNGDDEFDGARVFREPGDACEASGADVIVDFTNAAFTPVLVAAALGHGVPMVIGTTGHEAAFLGTLAQGCRERKVGAVIAPNFALGAVLMMHFARQAARQFETAEIIELHHDRKVDAPSGTAKSTAEQMLEARGRPFDHTATEVETVPGTRGGELGGIAIHSVRQPGLVAHQQVIFGSTGQTLTIRHDTTGRDSFMPGVLLAVRAVGELDRLVVGLEELLGLDG